jgi:hypothetical protein
MTKFPVPSSSTCVNTFVTINYKGLSPSKLTLPHPLQKFLAFNGTQRLVTVFTGTRHWFASSEMNPDQPPAYLN